MQYSDGDDLEYLPVFVLIFDLLIPTVEKGVIESAKTYLNLVHFSMESKNSVICVIHAREM